LLVSAIFFFIPLFRTAKVRKKIEPT